MERTRLRELLRTGWPTPLSETRNLHFSHSDAFVDIGAMADALIDRPFLVVLAVALPAVYGGVHLSAWKFEFPTPVEHLLWKIMCFIIIGAVPAMVGTLLILALMFLCADGVGKLMGLTSGTLTGDDLAELCYKIVGIIVLVAYGCARLYIVAESFLSLRKVPIGVYYTPPWLQMIPHA
jgi:hypothetical protein